MKTITTLDVCRALDVSEPALRHILRRPGAPRPRTHPTARLFLWTDADIDALRVFLADRCAVSESLATPGEERGQ